MGIIILLLLPHLWVSNEKKGKDFIQNKALYKKYHTRNVFSVQHVDKSGELNNKS